MAGVRDRLVELEAAIRELRTQEREKDQFVSEVSHELRTPLTSIRSFTEILLAHPDDRENREEFLGIIREESERLTRILDDLLDLAKIQSRRDAFEMVDVDARELIRAATSSVRALAHERTVGIDIEFAPEVSQVRGDRDKLMQVLVNLLSNALKFSQPNARIRVFAKVDEGAMITVAVEDDGPGIASADQERIFGRFQQVRHPGLRRGTGLGLPICREIVHRHGGRIWVESEPDRGSRFLFTIPSPSRDPSLSKSRGREETAIPC
ncbi:MAG: HAMP domain-containing sensor histidine kinase [Planctomycetota bacterium]